MVSTYKPTYYISLHDSITSFCKTILPFSFKKRRVPAIAAAEQRLSKQQSDNLKWQQDSFHHILHLMGLCKEGIVPGNEVSAFRTHLLETLIASPLDHEPPPILRDKLLFLQELLYAGCISGAEYHVSNRPLLQRLAAQGAEIEARDVIIGGQKNASNDEWSFIDLKDDKCSADRETLAPTNARKRSSAVKKIKGAAVSAFGFVLSDKNGRLIKDNNDANNEDSGRFLRTIDQNISSGNAHLNVKKSESKSIFAMESLPSEYMVAEKQILDNKLRHRDNEPGEKEKEKLGNKAWLIDGLKKWKNNVFEDDESAPTPLSSDENLVDGYEGKLVENPIAEGPDTKQIKRKLNPDAAPTDFFVDKVLGDNIKKELSRIKREYETKHPNVQLTDDQIEVISTRLPVDKEDLKNIFPKLWCDKYSDVVLDIVRKEFKEHMREMGSRRRGRGDRAAIKERRLRHNSSNKQVDDYDNENSHPNHPFARTAANINSGGPHATTKTQ